jgi:cobalt-zinc-cadmium efflux system outer membrane protein
MSMNRQDFVSNACDCFTAILAIDQNGTRGANDIRAMHQSDDSRSGHSRSLRPLIGLLGSILVGLLPGCATYDSLPLSRAPNLASSLSEINATMPPDGAGGPPHRIDLREPIGLDEIGLLAILNDPDLKSEAGEAAAARAGLVQASLLPNPSVSLGYGALLGGPGVAPSYAASLSEDVAALVTYRARVDAAEAHVSQVAADLLWREWQVAQKARLLALDIAEANRSIALVEHQTALLSGEVALVREATRQGNLTLATLAPLLAAEAAAEQSLATLKLGREATWQALDALLGLMPEVRFAIAPSDIPPLPTGIDDLLASLPERRPDLVALQLGYRSADEQVRAAILGQFPAFVLGGSWLSDTTAIRSAGPTVTFDLPIFNRNQGGIAQSRATRLVLHEQYQARLASAVGAVRGLMARAQRLSGDLVEARRAAADAEAQADTARLAYRQGNLDERSVTDYETAALERELTVTDIERSLGEAEIAATVELGLGLPDTTIATPARDAPL